jgi:hypothetical protein
MGSDFKKTFCKFLVAAPEVMLCVISGELPGVCGEMSLHRFPFPFSNSKLPEFNLIFSF